MHMACDIKHDTFIQMQYIIVCVVVDFWGPNFWVRKQVRKLQNWYGIKIALSKMPDT